ncbi:MAG TPA: DUF58 domain-containing protein [Phycisphaerae bacterium]|nr:DUF58 domain-containing protein [Phycisphaerae bacterium]HNU46937.1 DUF58 domain-containing protein [Phycisphaerae bacterium]
MATAERVHAEELLAPEFATRLEQLELISRKIFAGKLRGERRSKRRGESVEFADYRSYVVGDDLRFLDWNIYARLDTLFLKLFLQEEDLHVSLLFDVSRSMDWGTPHKGLYARRVAAALAYIGLVNFDRVSLYGYANGLRRELTGVRGRRFMPKVIDLLSNAPYEGESDLTATARQFAVRHPQPGVVLLLSDFIDKGGYEQGLRYLLGRRYDLYAVQILSPEEMEPNLVGDLQLRDVEDNDRAEVTISRALINRYKRNLQAYCSGLKEYCARRGVQYLFTSTEVAFDQMVLSYLRQRGLLR